jgi:hypothetical protein
MVAQTSSRSRILQRQNRQLPTAESVAGDQERKIKKHLANSNWQLAKATRKQKAAANPRSSAEISGKVRAMYFFALALSANIRYCILYMTIPFDQAAGLARRGRPGGLAG